MLSSSQVAQHKVSVCQWRRHKRHGFNPWIGKIPWGKKWQPTPGFLPESPWTGELGGLHAWDHKESDTTERLNTHVHIHTHFIQVMTYAVRHWGTAMTIDGQISVQRKLTF